MKKSSAPTPHSCNVLRPGQGRRQLWQFGVRNGQVNLVAHRTLSEQEPLPAKAVEKDWTTIFQRKLNIAWLPADQVFLRVVQLPAADYQELVSMVELQLEKLSPLPVAQIVWSMELMPKKEGGLQPVIVVMAGRALVEEFVGKLESAGYLADRLEVPCLHHLLGMEVDQDGVWVYPTAEAGGHLCLVAWWCGGSLQQIQLIHLPQGDTGTGLVVDQLTKTAWAGEVEGWLTPPVRCCLVADAAAAAIWEAPLTQWAKEAVTVREPLPDAKLTEWGAQRACRGESKTNLLPAEFVVRYKQQLIDRLWMGGLGAVLAVYVLGVLCYFAALQWLNYETGGVQDKVTAIANDYTNAIRLKERIEVLQNQLHLKYAALDCLKAVSEKLPTDLTLTSFQFQRGQKLLLSGTAPVDQSRQITDYNEDLSKVRVDGQRLFSHVYPPKMVNRASYGGAQTLNWDFSCDLNRRDTE